MSDYSTYFVAGPENILSNHQIGNENKEQTLVRIVKELALSLIHI